MYRHVPQTPQISLASLKPAAQDALGSTQTGLDDQSIVQNRDAATGRPAEAPWPLVVLPSTGGPSTWAVVSRSP